jgi:hypothetical protein
MKVNVRRRRSKAFTARLLIQVLVASLMAPVISGSLHVEAASATTCDAAGVTFPSSASSGFGGGLGTEASPWLICSRSQLAGISTNSFTRQARFELKSNIEMDSSSNPWTPLTGVFTGTLDGNYFAISNLYIAGDRTKYGLFETVGGTVKKLKFIDPRIVSESTDTTGGIGLGSQPAAGILAGSAASSQISEIAILNATISGNIKSGGFLYGESYTTNPGPSVSLVSISGNNSLSSNGITGGDSRLGGLFGIGYFQEITRASISASLTAPNYTTTGKSADMGGIMGDYRGASNLVSVTESYVDVDFNASGGYGSVGGLIGAGNGSAGTINNNMFVGTITTNQVRGYHGGLFGFTSVVPTFSLSTASITTGSNKGPLTGDAFSPISRSTPATTAFYNGGTNPPTGQLGTAKSEAELKTLSTYSNAGWDMVAADSIAATSAWSLTDASDPVWKITDGTDYPSLIWIDFWPLVQITYKANYPSGPVDQTQSAAAGADFNISANFVRTGFTLESWNSQMNGEGNYVDTSQLFSSVTDQILYAQWTADSSSSLYRDAEVPITASNTGPKPADTIYASAYERELSRELLKESTDTSGQVYRAPEEYVYRITRQPNEDSSNVDVQTTQSYTALTASQQQSWYEEILPNATYEFSWVAFMCVMRDGQGNAVLSQPISRNLSYASREDGLYGANSEYLDSAYIDYFDKVAMDYQWLGHSASAPRLRTVVGDLPELNSPLGDSRGTHFKGQTLFQTINNTPYHRYAALGVMDIGGTCAGSATLAAFPILDSLAPLSNSSANYVKTKSFIIPETLQLWDSDNGVSVEASAVGTLIGVTGSLSPMNAALWGLAQISSSQSSGSGGGSGSSYNPPTALPPVSNAPVIAKTKTVRYSNFVPNSSKLSRVAIIGIARTVKGFSKAETVVCTGYTSGIFANAFGRRVALERARNACNLAKRLAPDSSTQTRVSVAAGLGAKHRGVQLKITGQ